MATLRSVVAVTGLCLCGAASIASGQARQLWSVQGSALYTAQNLGEPAGTVGGAGVEAQVRRTIGRWSVGGGIQYSKHPSGPDDLALTGYFIEPRLVVDVGSGSLLPYLAGRLVYLRGSLSAGDIDGEGSAGGTAFGVGAGLIYGLTFRLNFDVGGALLRQSLNNIQLDDPSRLVIGFPSFFGYVVKAGFSVGL